VSRRQNRLREIFSE